jgi:hypothetical protein
MTIKCSTFYSIDILNSSAFYNLDNLTDRHFGILQRQSNVAPLKLAASAEFFG